MDRLNKKQTIKIIKDSINIQSTIEYDNNSFTINTKGNLMPKQENKVSLDSIYELMITKFDSIETNIRDFKTETNKRFESLEQDFRKLDNKLNEVIKLNNLKA